jgi:FixJ family two-component response regulator
MPLRPEVIVADGDAVERRAIQLLLRGHGYRVRAYPDVAALLDDRQAWHAALLLADDRVPGDTRLDLLRGLRADGWTGTAVLMTGRASDETMRLARAEGFQETLGKPVRPSALLDAAARSRAVQGAG